MTTPSSAHDIFLGYPRPDGRIGVRNHVAVIAVMDNVNPVARRICAQVPGTVPICVAYGRGMVAEDRDQHDRVLIHYGMHPNVAATLVIGLESVTAERFARAIAGAGKPVEWIAVQSLGGTVKAVACGIESAAKMVAAAALIERVSTPLSALTVGLECGASDATSGLTANSAIGRVADLVVDAGGTAILSETDEIIGAEHLLSQRAAAPEVSEQLLTAVADAEAQARFQGIQLLPLGEDNIMGGLSTMEEKSMGAVRKGGTSPLMEVVGYGERPSQRGLIFMDAPAPGVENIAAIAAGGAQVILFATGVGNPIGHPLVPTIKVTGNPGTARTFADNIDVDLGGIITGESDMDDAAERLKATLLSVANGVQTRSETLGDTEISISRVDVAFLKARRNLGS
ncbi:MULTISPECIES: UxaA family hydrolase [unclassified Beijerinckia]|uniref:UxaA family hydrolase n=1 Tax=unclassified Beijerinckia TaxID=2638183 RepID=UPI000896FE42|nr:MULTISPECIES: UxaA family hydrolase [unclassified Beijerinckia]MDH7798959.1 altronate dehydratase large subunit [Beijerinckia sp. GAS462]SED85891.1 altronate dehydratase large subunit [Beijerinckia sp. 28-YEA-48]